VWRFRKVFGRGPFRWTLSKRGIGWSWGIPGLRYGVSPSGQRYISFSIPGTGLYWIKYLKQKPQSPTSFCRAFTHTAVCRLYKSDVPARPPIT